MKSLFVIQSNYIPWKGYFDAINMVDMVIIHDDRQYTKNDWRNRNKIKTPDGTKWMTIPVVAKSSYKQTIEETKIASLSWNKEHWNMIQGNYAKAPYFKEYKEFFKEAYLNCNETYLSKINMSFIHGINKLLNIKTPIVLSSEFTATDEGKNERLIDMCKQTSTTDYYSGPAAKNYLDENLFRQNDINVHWLDYGHYKPYNQLYGDFIHEVSIIDLILNEGPNATRYMLSFENKNQ